MKKYVVVVISIVLVLCVGVSYSYFTSNTNNKENKLKISSKDLSIVLTDNMELNGNDITPGWSDSKSFTIKNNSNGSYNYNIVLKDLVNTFVTEGFLQYKITSINGYNTEGYINIPKSESPQDIVIGYDIDIEKGITQEYRIEFIYEDSEDIDQSEDMGKIFKGTLAIEEGTVNPNIKYSVTLNVDNATIEDTNIKETIKKGSVEFNVAPNEGYTLGTNVTCDNNANGVIENGKVTISNVTANTICTLDNNINTYIVTVISNNNNYGTVSPTSQYIVHGNNATITLSPKSGYKYSSNTCEGTISGNTMTINNVTTGKTCTVKFITTLPTLYAKLTDGKYYYRVNTRTDFDSALGSGYVSNTIYKESTYKEDGLDVYYFAGEVIDNWVLFAGFYWRIIRTNEDGSVRLLYAGTSPDTTEGYIKDESTYKWTYSQSSVVYRDTMYVGWKYGTTGSLSNNRGNTNQGAAKDALDNWYANNITGDNANMVSHEAIYCNDRSGDAYSSSGSMNYAGSKRLNRPTYKCGGSATSTGLYNDANIADKFTSKNASNNNGNKQLDYPVGLMTLDEYIFAGGTTNGDLRNAYFYKNSVTRNCATGGQSYDPCSVSIGWVTMTPSGTINQVAQIYYISGSDRQGRVRSDNVSSSFALRPVISLKGDVGIKSGDGTYKSPFIPTL